jgi:hypothetical protein
MTPRQLESAIKSLPTLATKNGGWLSNRHDLRWQIINNDPEIFLEWSTIQATMYVGQAPYIQQELDAVLEFYPSEILEPVTEEPTSYNGLSTNLIHQAYHLIQYETSLNVRVKELDSIIEFGGGYGALALIVHRLGFKGDYYIYDYPEFALLQEFYLSKAGIEVEHLRYNKKFRKLDMMVAIHSLNEVESSLERWRFLHRHPVMSYLFSYNSQWRGLDNYRWFKLIQQKRNDMDWVGWPIEHLPGRYYLVGAE